MFEFLKSMHDNDGLVIGEADTLPFPENELLSEALDKKLVSNVSHGGWSAIDDYRLTNKGLDYLGVERPAGILQRIRLTIARVLN